VSLKVQKGNADDALMNALHGGGWRDRAGAPKGSRNRHLAVTALGAGALLAAGIGAGRAAVSAAAGWAALTAGFAWKRIAPGPRTPGEVAAMVATSAAIPPLASYHWVAGLFRARRLTRLDRPAAVLVDRDGTLIKDVPYNGDPELVEPMPGALSALRRLREAEIPLAVISNQSGVARGLISLDQVAAVNQRVERELGPLGRWFVCPHGEADGCGCRKPAPGLLLEAVDALRVPASRCVFIGDIGSDVEAARAAGMRPILVPTRLTRPEEIERAEIVAPNLEAAVDLLLSPRRSRR
jgi:histidinol-phosphate phosphatase family protein